MREKDGDDLLNENFDYGIKTAISTIYIPL